MKTFIHHSSNYILPSMFYSLQINYAYLLKSTVDGKRWALLFSIHHLSIQHWHEKNLSSIYPFK